MAKYGRLQEFSSEEESFEAYLERVKLFFTANDVPDAKQVPVFLSTVGATTYALLRDLVSPDKPQDKDLDSLFKTLKEHFNPKPLLIAERFRFYSRSQSAAEPVSEFIAELRKLATHCDFKDFLPQALRDRFVCGLHNAHIQKRLLLEDSLTVDRAVELAQGLEAAEKSSKKLQGVEHSQINKVGWEHKTHKTPEKATCYRCGSEGHLSSSCRFREAECHKCHKKGHIAKVCRSSRSGSKSHKGNKKVKYVTANESPQLSSDPPTPTTAPPPEEEEVNPFSYTIFPVASEDKNPIVVDIEIEGHIIPMEVDTGATVSVVSSAHYHKLFPHDSPDRSKVVLTTYSGEQLKLIGEKKVSVKYGTQHSRLTLYVVEGNGPSLLGREWLSKIKLDWKKIGLVAQNAEKQSIDQLLTKYAGVFEEGLSVMNTYKAKLHLQPGCTPKYCKARNVPFALKPAVEAELDRLKKEGILIPVKHSNWAAPVVPVPKSDGRLRLCGDYKVTVNPVMEIDKYPLPKPDDLFATLAGGKKFSKIDLTSAYQQLSLEEECQDLVTINTHKGLFKYTRLPFGVASAPAIFQQVMDSVLQGLPNVICYIDDVLVTGSTVKEHLENLEKVLERLQRYNIRAKRSKCFFMCDSVEYLGHSIDERGLHTTDQKVAAVKEAPQPRNVQELRSFLGLLHYYGKFLSNLATLLHPLNALLRLGSKWDWTPECSEAFEYAKKLLITAPVLAHYDPSLPLKLAGDASAYGLGAVISHVMPDKSERPIAFASCTLSASEQNYSQIEKEALSLVFGLRRFHQYVYGRRFTLITDHKPLVTILGPKSGIPPLAAARMQRWALLLASHSYNIQYKRTQDHANADSLSRLPTISKQDTADCVFTIGQIQALPTTVDNVTKETQHDSILRQVYRFVVNGWPEEETQAELKPYWRRREELSTEGSCLLLGSRVIIPQKLRQPLLEELHRGHPGITRMKSVARSYMWWPGLDQDIEDLVKNCIPCQANRHNPAEAPLHPWIWPSHPWQRVHLDFAGPFLGRMFLIAVDAHSKWPEVIQMSSTTAHTTIHVLCQLFARYGLPMQVITDNGPQFTAEVFSHFLKSNGIKHIKSSPYHPSTNGLAERFVQTFKAAMRSGARDISDVHQRLTEFLLAYRSTPHATTSRPPCELFLRRSLRTKLSLIQPSFSKGVARTDKTEEES